MLPPLKPGQSRLSKKQERAFLRHMARKTPSERAILSLSQLVYFYERAKMGKCADNFVIEFRALKRRMRELRWPKEFIYDTFGVTFKELSQMYFKIVDGESDRVR
jgi:hypothetical protein